MIQICYSHYSIQQAFCHIDSLVNELYAKKVPFAVLADINSVSGCPEFLQLILKKNKTSEHKIIPILGFTIFINGKKNHILAKNKEGWFQLVKIISSINSKEHYKKYGNFDFQEDDFNLLNSQNIEIIERYENDSYHDVYYVTEEEALYQQIIICSKFHKTLEEKDSIIKDNPEYAKFFNSNNLCVKEYTEGEHDRLFKERFVTYDISMPPRIPSFKDENNNIVDPDQYLLNLCREGWKKRDLNKRFENNKELKEVYANRIKEELSVLSKYKLTNYILLVTDFVNYAKKNQARVGLRGSAIGSLAFYLAGVTDIDPIWPDPTIPYDPDKSLLFTRFINKGRLSEGKNALPDVDIDIPIAFRDSLKSYIYNKYGQENAAHIAAFGKIKAKMAIKEIFRIFDKSFDLANEITKKMVDESKIQDELEDIKQSDQNYNVINYNIDHIKDVGEYYKENKSEFDMAIKLNNTIRNFSQHAAGLVLADTSLKNFLPIYYDPDKDLDIVALKMQDVEYCGAVKYDLLSVAAYSKIGEIIKMIDNNTLEPEITKYDEEILDDLQS